MTNTSELSVSSKTLFISENVSVSCDLNGPNVVQLIYYVVNDLFCTYDLLYVLNLIDSFVLYDIAYFVCLYTINS